MSLRASGLALMWLASAIAPALAQDAIKARTEKWRPKDGVYAAPGKDFEADCGEADFLEISISTKRVSGNEWGCDIKKITDTAPDAIRLDMGCHDNNLAESLKLPEDKLFKETLILRKVDQNSIFMRITSNGRFSGRGRPVVYCSEEMQRMHAGIQPEPWLPRDGVYASPGADFDDRCLKSVDTVVDLAGKNISSGPDHCEISSRIDPGPGDSLMTVTCNETRNTKGEVVVRYMDNWPMVGPPGFEIMKLTRIDDKTIALQKTHDGKSSEPARQVAYCGDEAQRAYLEAKARDKAATEQKAADQPAQRKQ